MCVRCWAVYIILTVSRQLHKSHNSIHNARPDNSGCELLLFSFYLRRATDWIACAIFRSYSFSTCHDENSIVTNKFALYVHISVYKKALPITDRKGELALYHLRLHRSIYIHINSNASCPVTWTNRKNLCRKRLSGFFGSKATFHDFCLKHLSACPKCITILRTGCSL